MSQELQVFYVNLFHEFTKSTSNVDKGNDEVFK